jgi:NAD(P)-dependent dehydrogenase (short-subunit alcohol dehydrogenase family)
MTDTKVAVVAGVGPGLGQAVARRFAREGFAVALMSRTEEKLEPVRAAIEAEGGRALPVPCDASEPPSVSAAFAKVRAELGDPSVLVYNAGAFRPAGILELSPGDLERCWRVGAFGAFLCAREVLPKMAERGEGTVLITGATASLRGSARFAALAAPKFALRALSQSMAREFGPEGVHVAHVIIDGQIDLPRTREAQPGREAHTFLSPDAIAETYWHLHSQDRTAWTQEMDLRPAVEKW